MLNHDPCGCHVTVVPESVGTVGQNQDSKGSGAVNEMAVPGDGGVGVSVIISEGCSVQSGQEVFFSYGKKSNLTLLRAYGFVQFDNLFDTVDVDVLLDPDGSCSNADAGDKARLELEVKIAAALQLCAEAARASPTSKPGASADASSSNINEPPPSAPRLVMVDTVCQSADDCDEDDDRSADTLQANTTSDDAGAASSRSGDKGGKELNDVELDEMIAASTATPAVRVTLSHTHPLPEILFHLADLTGQDVASDILVPVGDSILSSLSSQQISQDSNDPGSDVGDSLTPDQLLEAAETAFKQSSRCLNVGTGQFTVDPVGSALAMRSGKMLVLFNALDALTTND